MRPDIGLSPVDARPARAAGRRGLSVCAALLALALGACAAPPVSRTAVFTGPAMGTTWIVKVVAPGAEGLDAGLSRTIDQEIRDELARINQLMSTWDPDSELSLFNASVSTEPVAVAPETFDVFRWSRTIWDETGGALDPTVAPLLDVWGFGVDRSVPVPDEATVARLREDTGMALVELDPEGNRVRKIRPGVRCEFSAIAPGYAADRIAARLDARGLDDFLIDVSGELVGRGRNEEGRPWQVAVERPDTSGRSAARVVSLADRAMATSGDYRNFRELDGERFTHILDPRTGRPVHHTLASVTVFDDLGVRADGLSTALMVMGPVEAEAFAERHGVPALFLIRRPDGSFEERHSTAFDAMQAVSEDES